LAAEWPVFGEGADVSSIAGMSANAVDDPAFDFLSSHFSKGDDKVPFPSRIRGS